jgi:uncharacterized protein (DUF1684 family)
MTGVFVSAAATPTVHYLSGGASGRPKLVEALAESSFVAFVKRCHSHCTLCEWPSKRSKTNVEAKPMTGVFVSAAATPTVHYLSGGASGRPKLVEALAESSFVAFVKRCHSHCTLCEW